MTYIDTLKKWKSAVTIDANLQRELSSEKDIFFKQRFENKLQLSESSFFAETGAGTDRFNEFSLAAIVDSFALSLISASNSRKRIFVAHGSDGHDVMFANIAAKVLSFRGVDVIFNKSNKSMLHPLLSLALSKDVYDASIMISSKNGGHNYCGITLMDSDGVGLQSKAIKEVNKLILEKDFLSICQGELKVTELNESLENEYLDKVCSGEKDVFNNLNVAYSALGGMTSEIISKVIEQTGSEVFETVSKTHRTPRIKGAKLLSLDAGEAFGEVSKVARKNKSDIMLLTDPSASKVAVAVKHKKRYKYLKSDHIATLYMDYLVNFSDSIKKDSYIITTETAGELAQKIGVNHGIRVVKVNPGFDNISRYIKSHKENFLFAFDGENAFLPSVGGGVLSDGIQALKLILEISSFHKKNGENLYTRLKKIYRGYGIHRTVNYERKLNTQMQKRTVKALKNLKRINGQKISEIIEIEDPEADVFTKFRLESGSWFVVRTNSKEKMKIYIQSIGTKKQELHEIVVLEKAVEAIIKENSEVFQEKKFTLKVLLKYTIFISIVVGILSFVFLEIYQTGTSNASKSVSTYTIAQHVFHSRMTSIWLVWWITKVAFLFLAAWEKHRMFKMVGKKVAPRHLVISAIMGSVIAFVTPFAVGGDAIGYWYLRRKKVERGPLLAVLASKTMLGEAKFTIQTVFLVGIGWGIYKKIFMQGDPQSTAALVMFFVGMAWSIFATAMIFILTLSKRVQEFIVKKSIIFLEWFIFTNIYDPGRVAAGYQYEFYSLRGGMRRLWSTWWFPIEMIFYEMIFLFVAPFAMLMATAGMIDKDVPAGQYFAQLVSSDIVGTANSLSITPGGSGTGEWLSITTKHILYDGSQFHKDNPGYSPKAIASGVNLFFKIIYSWPWLLFSATLIGVTVFIENVNIRIENNKRNARLRNLEVQKYKKHKVIGGVILVVFWALYLVGFYTFLL